MSFSSTCPNHATFHFRWTLLAATPNNMIIEFIITPTSQSDGVSMSASSRRSRYNLLRTLYHKASLTKWFNKRYLAAKLNNMIFAFIIPQSKSGRVVYLAFSTYKSSQNLYFVEKNSLQNRRNCACFQLGIKICLSTPRTLLLKSGIELFWFPENKATSRCFACSLKEITVLLCFIIPYLLTSNQSVNKAHIPTRTTLAFRFSVFQENELAGGGVQYTSLWQAAELVRLVIGLGLVVLVCNGLGLAYSVTRSTSPWQAAQLHGGRAGMRLFPCFNPAFVVSYFCMSKAKHCSLSGEKFRPLPG